MISNLVDQFIYFLILFTLCSCGVDVGDGSDGVCTDETFSSSRRNYNCQSLTLTGNLNATFSGVSGSAVVIKVIDSVNIEGSLGVNGLSPLDAGGAGVSGALGGLGGAGGAQGADCIFDSACGLVANDNNGQGDGGGVGGRAGSDPTFFSAASGGGGSGGSFGSVGTNGGVGSGDGGTTPGVGGVAPATYGVTSTWDITFAGGSGGGAGGYGVFSGTSHKAGGAGGGGGGALRIISGGDINIQGGLNALGGGGGTPEVENDFSDGGCGGGGSGGAIWLQAKGNITISGSVLATGGLGDDCTSVDEDGGAGGNGGAGRIRFDDGDGSMTITGTVNPPADMNTIGNIDAFLAEKREYDGDISCGTIAIVDDSDGTGGPFSGATFFSSFLLGLFLYFICSFFKLIDLNGASQFITRKKLLNTDT